MDIHYLLERLHTNPETVMFDDVIALIDEHYSFEPVRFSNGTLENAPGQNNGSCKIFAFALMHKLSTQQTLHCFGDYYRKDVLDNPAADNHRNIRNFMQTGWDGISFEAAALTPK